MPPLAIVEDLEVLEQRRAGHELGWERLAGEQFTLQGRKSALSHGVVVAVAYRPH